MVGSWAGDTAEWTRIWAGTSIILIKHAQKKLIFLKHPLARNEVFAPRKSIGQKCHALREKRLRFVRDHAVERNMQI
jgi:hypothetical protein